MIINLLSSPRNVSTAFMYSFARRSDTRVIDEPFYGVYLKKANDIRHPGFEEILKTMPLTVSAVLNNIENTEKTNEIVFLKNMTHHFGGHQPDYLAGWKNIIFIRDPDQIIQSFSKVIPNPSMDDIGIKMQVDMFNYLSKAKGKKPIVLDSKDLLSDPKNVLSKLCEALEISFDDKMLSWPAGAREEDGVWAKHWYNQVHQSTGFTPVPVKKFRLKDSLLSLAREAKPYYSELRKHAISIS